MKIPLHNERSCQSVFQSNKLSISWFLSRRCILRSLGVNARTGLDSPFSSVVSFSNTFAIAGLSLCSLGRSLNRTCGKNRNDPYMTGAIKGLNWAKTMRYVGHHCLIPGSCGLSGSPCLPGSPGQSWIHHPNTLTAKVSVNAEKVSILASRIMTGASGGKALQAIIPTWEKENSKDLNQRGRQRRRKLHPKIGFALFQISSLLLQLFQFVTGWRFFQELNSKGQYLTSTKKIDCEQSPFFFRFSESNARARERRSRETRETRASASPVSRHQSRLAICVFRVLLDGLQKKRETARGLWSPKNCIETP